MTFKLELSAGSEAFRGSRGYDNPMTLLQDLYDLVKELETGVEVLSHDEPSRNPPTMGFSVSKTIDGVLYWWEFFISITDLQDAEWILSQDVARLFKEDRVPLAKLLQKQIHPELF